MNQCSNIISKTIVPKLRFKEFEEEWEEKKLGDIASFSKGKGISKSDIHQFGTIPCIRYGELYTEYSELIKTIISKTNLPKEDLVISLGNEVVIPASGETAIDIATASCILISGVAIGGDLNIIHSKLDGVFLSYLLNNSKKNKIASLAQGSSVMHLYSTQLKLLSVNYPNSFEQKKIADFLSSVDNKIELVDTQITQTESFKKGLLQQMFV